MQVGLASLLVALVLGAAVVALLISFSWPTKDVGGGWFEVGSVIDFEVNEPVTFTEREFHLVKQEDGSFLALYWASPYLGYRIDWRPDYKLNNPMTGETQSGWFVETHTSSLFDVNGELIFGPAPRSMDRLPVKVEDGRVYVFTHPSQLIKGGPRGGG